MDFKDAMDTMVVQIREMVQNLISQAKYDKTYIGVVTSVSTKNGSQYFGVLIQGKIRSIKSSYSYNIGNFVTVLVPQNNWSNARIIVTASEIVDISSSAQIVDGTTVNQLRTEINGHVSTLNSSINEKVSKSNVVNNFTTNQDGYVADARTVYSLKQTLDGMGNTTVLLSTSESSGTFTLSDSLDNYRFVLITYNMWASNIPIFLPASCRGNFYWTGYDSYLSSSYNVGVNISSATTIEKLTNGYMNITGVK